MYPHTKSVFLTLCYCIHTFVHGFSYVLLNHVSFVLGYFSQ